MRRRSNDLHDRGVARTARDRHQGPWLPREYRPRKVGLSRPSRMPASRAPLGTTPQPHGEAPAAVVRAERLGARVSIGRTVSQGQASPELTASASADAVLRRRSGSRPSPARGLLRQSARPLDRKTRLGPRCRQASARDIDRNARMRYGLPRSQEGCVTGVHRLSGPMGQETRGRQRCGASGVATLSAGRAPCARRSNWRGSAPDVRPEDSAGPPCLAHTLVGTRKRHRLEAQETY